MVVGSSPVFSILAVISYDSVVLRLIAETRRKRIFKISASNAEKKSKGKSNLWRDGVKKDKIWS